MNLWRKIVRFFSPECRPHLPRPPLVELPHSEADDEVDRRLKEAGKKNAAANFRVQRAALKHIDRAEDIRVVLNQLMGKIADRERHR